MGAEEPVAGIAEPWQDEGDIVQLAVERRDVHRHVRVALL